MGKTLMGFPCPCCGGNTKTTDSRMSNKLGRANRRRRKECLNCGERFTTREVLDGSTPGDSKLPKLNKALGEINKVVKTLESMK